MDLLQEEESLPSLTKDGEKVVFLANADSADEVRKAHRHGCEGVGLFRTESVFLRKNEIPSEDEQFEEYRQILEAAALSPLPFEPWIWGGTRSSIRSAGKKRKILSWDSEPFIIAFDTPFSLISSEPS